MCIGKEDKRLFEVEVMDCKLLLFDLDGTLLQSDKSISKATMCELDNYRKHGVMIGISTSRSEKNCMQFIEEVNPDVVISSAGALIKYKDEHIYKMEFSEKETKELIQKIAFGDDYADIGMLKLCGVGVAMGNAIDEVKAIADCVIGDNDHDGIAKYLQQGR